MAKGVLERRSRSPQSPVQQSRWDSESGTGTEDWTPDNSESSNSNNSNDLAVDLLAEENTKPTRSCTQESQTNTHTSQATYTPCSSSPHTTDRRWRALMRLPVEEFLKLDIIHKIIENLSDDDLVYVVEQALKLEDLDYTVQKRTQYEVICTSQKQRIDFLNHNLREEVVENLEYKSGHAKYALHNKLFFFCRENPEKKSEMLRNHLRQVSTLKAFNALARQIWGLSAEERDKLGDDAIQYIQRQWPPVRW
ncbi:uncharacterized protein CDV56_104788 [Aspergillus thermomutatus]|uniref:Uncharacterized protein n=1 Tax=Aspergillus thermomutatus TaxID=41047 RepID=A0A397H0Q8_ASPTH|nr:uncharacterized protein CDV56_104788 [Aspergillus thermomutatus]RHZ56269.1 hypothetical protein CDV56_104788 [Aspergillus thermomutatus]